VTPFIENFLFNFRAYCSNLKPDVGPGTQPEKYLEVRQLFNFWNNSQNWLNWL